ncbi:MAG: GNAT family N-acetyltransferase, partial [Propionibacteriaceae bacterium]
TADVVAARLADADFTHAGIHYGHDWPGDLLNLFPHWAQYPEVWTGQWTMTTSDTAEAIGAIGLMSPMTDPQPEIGYGVIAQVEGQGYATEAVQAVSDYLFTDPVHTGIIAHTAVTNPASARVLSKAGYHHISSRTDAVDGELMVWQRLRAAQ